MTPGLIPTFGIFTNGNLTIRGVAWLGKIHGAITESRYKRIYDIGEWVDIPAETFKKVR